MDIIEIIKNEREGGRPGWWAPRRQMVLLLAVLLLASVLRMGWPGLTEFKGDEARLMTLSLEMASLQRFPLRGISSSVGVPNFPASVWLYALPLFVSSHAYAPTLFTGLLNVLAVLGAWWLARRYWGPRAALLTALLLAVSPWAVVHSRKIWAQNLLPPLVTAWAISGALAFIERRPWWAALHLFLLALAAQVHFAAITLLPVTFIYLLVFRRRLQWRPLLAGAGLALLPAVPFLVYLLSNPGGGLQRFPLALGESLPAFSLRPWRYLLLLSTGRQIHSLAGPEHFPEYLARVPFMEAVQAILTVLLAGSLLFMIWQGWRRRDGRQRAKGQGLEERHMEDKKAEMALFLLVWLLVPPLILTWFPVDVALHYLLPAYPAPFVLAGAMLGWLLARLGRWRSLLWVAVGTVAALQVVAWAVLLGLLATRATPGGFGTPLSMKLEATAEARRLQSEHNAPEILLAGPGEEWREVEFAAVYHALLWDTPHRFVDATRSAVFPAQGAIVMVDSGLNSDAVDTYRGTVGTVQEIPLRSGEGQLHLLALAAGAAPSPDVVLPEPVILANYVKIIGHNRPPVGPGDRLFWRITWQTADSPLPQKYHFFNHLLGGTGQRLAQADGAAFLPRQWQQGDVVVTHFTMDVPQATSSPFTMRTGMYRYPSLENVPLLDVAGNPYADALEVELGD